MRGSFYPRVKFVVVTSDLSYGLLWQDELVARKQVVVEEEEEAQRQLEVVAQDEAQRQLEVVAAVH